MSKKFKGIQKFLSKFKEKDKSYNNYHMAVIKSRSRHVIVISIFLLIISFLIQTFVIPYCGDNNVLKNIIESICTYLNMIVSIVAGLGIGSMSLDFFSYVKYTQERIKEIMVEKKYLNTLSDEEKKDMINILETSVYFKGQPMPSDSLYKNIHEKILPLLDKEYLTDYYCHIDCCIEDGKIIKNMTHKLKIYSNTENTHFTLPFAIYMKHDENNAKGEYQISSIVFNDEQQKIPENKSDLLDTKEINEHNSERQTYHHLKLEFSLKKGENCIEYISRSIVDLSDNIFSHNLTLPCKHYISEISFNNNDFSASGYAFTIDKMKTAEIKKFANSCRIEMNDWSLPGDGIIFVINKNNT